MTLKLGTKRVEPIAGRWSRDATVDGVTYRVGVTRGRPVRIAFARRGSNIGHKWDGWVMQDGRYLWSGTVPGSLGARGLLLRAGVLS